MPGVPAPRRRGCLPSAAVLGPSARVVPVLFFLRCFFLLACGDGGGSSLGLAAVEMLGLELRESAVPLAMDKEREDDVQRETPKGSGDGSSALPGCSCTAPSLQMEQERRCSALGWSGDGGSPCGSLNRPQCGGHVWVPTRGHPGHGDSLWGLLRAAASTWMDGTRTGSIWGNVCVRKGQCSTLCTAPAPWHRTLHGLADEERGCHTQELSSMVSIGS